MKDYYQILGILETASQEDIRQAYLQLALIWHPDRHAGEPPGRIASATASCKEIGEAYGVLSDPAKKADYDWSLRRNRVSPSPRPSGSSASAAAAGRPPAGRPSSTGRQSSRTSGGPRGSATRADSSYSRERNWGGPNTDSRPAAAATWEQTISSRVSDFIFDVLRAVWEILYAGVTFISCAIKIYSRRMSRRHKQTYTV